MREVFNSIARERLDGTLYIEVRLRLTMAAQKAS